MSDMTVTMTFKAVDEVTAVLKGIMAAEKDVQAVMQAGATMTSTMATDATTVVTQQVEALQTLASQTGEVLAIAQAEAAGAIGAAHGDRKWGPIEWDTAGLDNILQQAGQAQATLDAVGTALQTASAGVAGIGAEGGAAAEALGAMGEAAGGAWEDIQNAANATSLFDEFGGSFKDAAIVFAGNLAGNLAAAGISAAATAASNYIGSLLDQDAEINAAIRQHADLVRTIKTGWDANAGAVKGYGEHSLEAFLYDTQRALDALEQAERQARANLETSGPFGFIDQGGALFNPAVYRRADAPLREMRDAFRADELDGRQFEQALVAYGRSLPEGDWQHKLIEAQRADLQTLIATEVEKAKVTKQLEEFRSAGTADVDAVVAIGAEIEAAMPPALPDVAFDELAQGAADAAAEIAAVVTSTADVEPAMNAASGGLDLGTAALLGLDPAAAGAAGSVGHTANEIARMGTNAAAATEQLTRLQATLDAVSPARLAVTPMTPGAPAAPAAQGFAGGGYTGDMPVDAVAGLVHGQEYVFDAAATAAIGVETLDVMRATGSVASVMSAMMQAEAANEAHWLAAPSLAISDLSAMVETMAAPEAREHIAALPGFGSGDLVLDVTLSAPVTISGQADRTTIEREVKRAFEESSRELMDVIDEQQRLRARRAY